ncbi:thioesterase II family protein [Pseudomonas sessilinigenes]|uniref:Alpha/beta fold hydrolase n=1 Tax=Pseudomonas sessilinigenes TaxID=658629 RepID=A0ABX8MIA0_9PSED|nr:alpha/beta fold hydrolase [Pseudomonas sessilinigenes]QXH37869.1 alpha/beta fold hydrolase [Pseudomonas sessilinigenes]
MKKPQIFTLHFAGGNCYSYQFMKPALLDFDVVSVELPGRGRRMAEPLIRGFEAAAKDMFQQIVSQLTGSSFILYGHSMGAILGLKVARMLEDYEKKPSALIFTGHAGPKLVKYKNTAFLETQELKQVLLDLGGLPDSVIHNSELFSFFEPVIRADFEVAERADSYEFEPVDIPLHVVMGTEEDFSDKIGLWEKYTTSSFSKGLLSGDHFFIHNHICEIAAIAKSMLSKEG